MQALATDSGNSSLINVLRLTVPETFELHACSNLSQAGLCPSVVNFILTDGTPTPLYTSSFEGVCVSARAHLSLAT